LFQFLHPPFATVPEAATCSWSPCIRLQQKRSGFHHRGGDAAKVSLAGGLFSCQGTGN